MVSLDAGIQEVRQTLPGTRCLKVVLRNFGTTTITSAKIDWKLNGVSKTQVSWSGSLAKGDTDIVCLGNITFLKDSLYMLKAWSSAPNSGTDLLKSNDTLWANFYTAMNGEYSVGGTSPDFASFTAAVAAVEQNGIIDSVLFKVRNGTYTEQIEINSILGANHKNSIIFQSESKDSTKVILQYDAASYDYNYVVWLNGCNGITFRKMTLKNITSSYSRVVYINNETRNPMFENNIFQNFDSTSSNDYRCLVYFDYNMGDNISFLQNVFHRGSYGIYIYGDYSNREKNIVIKQNSFNKQGYTPLYLYYIDKLTLSDNIINAVGNNLYYGTFIEYLKGLSSINNNKINVRGNNANYGLYIYNYSPSANSDSLNIYNNFISISGAQDGIALYTSYLDNTNIYYNNLLNECTDSSGSSTAFYFSGGELNVYNNNFIHLKNGYAYYTDYINYFKSNFNNLYSNGTKYIYWDGVPYSNLNSYKSATALDANSIEADPIYTSSTDLHIAYVGLNAKAKKIAAITKDIDGETRNSTTPDIGADEFTPPSLDAGVTKLFSPGSLYMADTLNVDVIVTNFGLDTIKKVTVQIKINNDTLARKIFTRTFPSGDTIHVRLGQYIFKNDSIYKLTVWSSLPNGATDQKKSNDTLKVLNSSPAMSGVYTIGGTTPNFPTFKAAIKALKLKGMLDSVRFRVRAGTYTEQLSIPFINGAGARNSIIFESQDKDTTKVFLEYGSTYSDTNYVIQLNGAGGVTFRYMHITATSSSNYNHVFDIRGKAHKNTIYKNIIEGPNTNYGSSNNALIYSGQDADDYLLIKDNHIKNGDYGIYLYGNPSSSPYNYEKGLEISGNKILNPFYRGMYIYYADTVNISGNYIYSDKYYSFYGMQLNYLRTNLKINRNIMDLKQGYYGIYMYECGSSFKRGLISNNAFYLKNPSNYSYGIYAYYNYYIDFIHNSINIDNSYTSSTAFQMYYGNNNSIYNNIFVNNGSGYSIYVYSTSSLTSNKNDLFSKGSSLGNWNGTNIPDISTWKSTSAKDTNSLSVDPIFKSAYDLHAKEISINGAAKYFKSVPLDFDNQTRDTLKPDIGADEFSLPQNDAGIHKILVPQKPFPADSQFVKVALKNFGGNSITTVSIRWKFNNVTQTAYSWSGTLLSGDTVHVKLAKRYFDIDSSYDLKAWTSNPNGTADSVNSNDTMQVLDQYPALSGIYTIGGTTPDFSTFTAAINAMKQGGIVDSVRFDVRTGTYNEQIKIPYIYGANKENAIIFQSELKDSSKVKLIGTPTSSNNYTVSLDSVNGVTFRYMRLSTTLPSSYNRVIQMLGACKNINIHNCHIIGKLSTTTGDNEALVYIYNSNSSQPSFNSIKFFKNNFDRGSFGFYVYGYSSFGHGKNLNIYQNNFENQYYMGAYPRYVRDFVFNKNNVYRTNTGYSSGFGIYADYLADGYTITNNKIYNQEYYGIYMNQCNGVTGDTSLIANNFIHVRNNNNSYGLYVYYPNYLNIFNNNIHITSTNSSSYAAYIYYPTYTTVFNNNFITSGAGYAMYCYSGSLIKSNYNNFYTNGTYVANRTSTNYTDLAAWKSATGYDAKSISVNPQYTSNTDLHVAAIDLNAIGRNHKYIITKDIDDQNRDTLKPDIGADEFSPPTLDVGVSQLFSPGSLYKAGTLNVDVIVKNYGIDTVKKVTVQIKINNDTLTRKIFTRTFPSGDTIHVRLGQYTFKADSIYNFTTWSSLPNGEADHKKSNDTLRVLNSRTAMTGVYTIGGTTPNFTTFKAAVNALKLAGMLDSVRFRVRTGTYTEQLTIPAINGSGARNSIIFESQDKDTTKVTLQYNSVYSDTNWVVCLNGADGITFRYMKIKAISTSNYNHVFNIKGKAQYNSINNNIIEGPNTTNASSNNALIYSGADADDYLLIKDNHIRKGDFGIYLYGYPPTSPYTYEKGLEISGNKILNPYYMGIYLEYADTVNISDNYIYSDKYYYSYGMYLYTCYTNLKVNRNILDLRQGYYGIYMYQSGNSYKRNLISNNAIYLKNSSNYSYGIYAYYNYYTDFIHNSINIDNPYTSSYAFQMYYGNNNSLYNNIFANKGTGYSIYVYSSSSLTSNNNDLFGNGSNLGNWNGTNLYNFSTWKSTTGLDANSISVDPIFKSASNLHAKELLLNAGAKYFKSVPLDFDNETRDTLKPDIGADEFSLPSNDAGISNIIVPNKPFPADTQQVKVVIKNFGGNKLYVADINWKFNGVAQTAKAWADTLQSGDTMHVKLGKKFFHPDSGYSVIVWTSNPNGTGDSIKSNDTLKVFNQYPALSGIYTIGGASPDFATFTDAVTAMKRGGIIDSVRFDVRSGTYYEQIEIPYITGANSENDIIFQSELKDSSKVFLISTNTSSDNYTVRLDSTNGATFRYMSLGTTGVYYYNRIFELLQTVKNINIHNCNLMGAITTTDNTEALIYIYNTNSSLPAFDNIEVYNNRLTKGSYGLYVYGYSTSGSGYGKDLNVHNNNLEDQYYMGVQMNYSNNFKINSNAIYHTSTSGYSNGYGIYSQYSNDGFEITNNNIYNQEYYGVYLYQCIGKFQDTALFANNFIHCRTNNNVYGLQLYYSDYLNFFNNNIHISSTNASSYAAYIYSSSRTASYSNNFVTTGAGYAIYLTSSLTKSDFNNYFTTGSILGYYSGNRADLAAWKSATGKDAKSLSVNPDYVTSRDLHVRGTDLNGVGRNHKYLITKDIDGQNRNATTPDIGADEFDIPAGKDAGISSYVEPIAVFASGSRSVKVVIKNFGSDSLKSATIKWRVNGTLQSSYSWTGALKTSQTQTVTIGNFNFVSGIKYTLDFWTTSPNGGTDTTNYNDTTHKYNVYAALDGVYSVGGTSTPDFATLTEAFTALKLGGISDSVWFKIASGNYSYDLVIESYPGAHKGRPVYIESQSGDSSDVVIANSNSSGQIIYINGADYLKFRNVTFKPTSAYGVSAVRYDNTSTGLSFENCYFDLTTSATYYYYYTHYSLYSSSSKDDSLTVKNCRFDKGMYAIYTYSNSGNEKGINISNNIFTDQNYTAIYMQYADAPKIRYNILTNTVSSSNAINLYNTGLELTVSHNKIHYSQAGATGIYLYYHSGSSGSKANIFNNFIAIKGSSGSEEGLFIYNSNYVNIYHNSMNVYGTNTTSYALLLQYGGNFDVRNNIYSNMGGGYAIGYLNSPTISQANYNDIYSTGTNLGNYNGANQTTFAAWKSASSRDVNSVSLNPTYNSDYDLHTNLSSLDSACNPISGITDDIDLETRNTTKPDIGADEFQSLPENLGVLAFVTPVNSCNLDSAFVKVKIFNYGNKAKVGFPVRYRINGGTIKTGTVNDTIKPGKEVQFQFATKEPFAINTSYVIKSWTDLTGEKYRANDSLKITFTNYQKPDSVTNMVPANGTTGLDYPFTLSWAPSNGATRYDVYVWPFATSRPGTPTLANTTQISYQISGGLTYGDKYNWQIEAKNPICATPGKVQTFTMKHLPDLIVQEVNAPNTAFSANTISVSWKIKNNGQGAASGSWYDALFLSSDGVLDVTDVYLGAFINPAALNPTQNYTQSASVTLPNGISGNYYIFVRADQYNYLSESDNSNNSDRDTSKMVVTLTPPPDLIVFSVTRPSVVFSGNSANVTYVIKNKGTGATRSGGWYDNVYLSTEKVVNGSSYYLFQNYHSGNLKVDSTYQVTSAVTIPNFISGKYFFVVQTDIYNQEYEHASENNNSKGSDTIKVILTPPPDLIIKNLQTIDTASNSQSVLVKYNIINDGGTSSGSGFYDFVFLSPTSTYNYSTATYIGNKYQNVLASKDTIKVAEYYTMPQSLNGTYYLFIVTDYYNYVNEVSNESNNVSSGYKIVLQSPDLKVSRVIVSATDTTGSNTPVKWTVKNHGPGHDYQGSRTDSIYISKSATWNRNNSTAVGSYRYSATILKNDTLPRSSIVRIPDGFDGNRYFFVVADAAKEVFEKGNDTNNYKRSNLMNVILAPYPDLKPKLLSFPDSAKAGGLIGLGYQVKNQGKAKANPDWKDRFYFSKDSVFNLTKVFTLTENTRATALDTQALYEKTVYMTLPASLAKGNYYYFIFTDADKMVYEHFNDSNNIVRSKKIFINGYPPVDLKVNCPSIADTMWSGNSYQLTYSVKNIGQAKTAVGAWNDGAYLSTDSILSTGDILIATIAINKTLEKDSTYNISQTINIPNGMEGNFYLLVKADITRLIKDVDTSNNIKNKCKSTGGAKKLRINLSPPPDLKITSWNIPSTGTSGQAFKIKWKVENKGSGTTRSGSWMDNFYLSTDYTIDNSDYPLGEKRHTGNLAVNGNYNDSQEFSIPLDKVGNYIVIIKTDGANAEYEHTNEGNNIVSAVSNFTKAPPADLIVLQVTSPSSVLSGKTVNITWKVKNKGSNPATGYLRDNVYLSKDNKQDGSDLLLTSVPDYISLAPNAEITNSETVAVSGIALGNYYVLVTTDVLNNINESNDTNNTNTAANLLNVNVPILPIAVKTKDTLTNNEKIYYRIIISDSLAGESMLITLKADSIKGNNEIFVRHDLMVSGSQFDYKYREPFKGNQEIIIPELKSGTYYLLTTGKTTNGTVQNITLFARIMPFEIRKVTPSVGGNTGQVTVMIEGSKLDDPSIFFNLIKSGSGYGSITNDTLGLMYKYSLSNPLTFEVVDPTIAYATFELAGKDTGRYDVSATKGINQTAVLVKGFKVVPGKSEDLEISISRPGSTRASSSLYMDVLFTNSGNTDIINKKIKIISSGGAPIALSGEDLSKNITELDLIVQGNDGPAKRLRPGASGSVRVYTKSSAALGLTIIK